MNWRKLWPFVGRHKPLRTPQNVVDHSLMERIEAARADNERRGIQPKAVRREGGK